MARHEDDRRIPVDHQAAGLLRPAPTARNASSRAPWVTVAGGKGGVGKTLLSVNLAVLAARTGRRVLLVDFDPGLANIAVHLRLAPRFDLADLISGHCSSAEAVTNGPAGLGVICGRSGDPTLAGGGEHDAETSVKRALAAIDAAATAYGADLVLVDTGAGIGPSVIRAAGRAAASLCVTTPEPSALTDAYALIKVLRGEHPSARISLVLNRTQDRDEALRLAGRMQQITRRFLGFEPDFAGGLREDRELARSVAEQVPAAVAGTGRGFDELRALLASVLSNLPTRRAISKSSAGRQVAAKPAGAASTPQSSSPPTKNRATRRPEERAPTVRSGTIPRVIAPSIGRAERPAARDAS